MSDSLLSHGVTCERNVIRCRLYKALVLPHLEYCSTVWDSQSICATQRWEMVQRRAGKYVLIGYHNTSSVSDILDHLQWPTLTQRQCCNSLTLLYKITHKGKARHFKTFPQAAYKKINFSLDLFLQLYFQI